MQAQELPDGLNIRFSWANVNHTGALYYRVTLTGTTSASTTYSTTRENQAFVDIPKSIVTSVTFPFTGWRVELYDSTDITTQRNRFHSAGKAFSTNPILTFNAANPVINNYRVRNVIKSTGLPYTQVAVNASGSQSTLAGILVTGPAYSRNLLALGRYSPGNGSYTLEEPGTLTAGLYTITVTNAAGRSATRFMHVPTANPLPQPDYTTTRIDTEPNGDMRISWAPVVSTVPVWYSFRMFSLTDLDGDGLVEVIYAQSVHSSNSFQQTSIVIPAGSVTMPAAAQVSVSDGSGFSVVSNVSSSAYVGPGGTPVTDPFAAGNDGLATAITDTNPASGATGIPTTGSTVSVAFNKVIDQRSLPISFTVTLGLSGMSGTVSYNPSTRTATFTPSGSLLPGTTYTATLSTGLQDQAGNALGAPYSWSFTTAGSLPSLAVTIIGNGNVNSNTGSPGIHGAVQGIYTSPYAWGTPVTLTATTQTGWDFGGWTGDCTSSLLTCSLTMDAQTTNVTASFTLQQNIKNGSSYYGTLTSAFQPSSVANNDILQIKSFTFVETPEIVYNVPGVSITLKGGFIDAGFLHNSGANSIVDGILKIRGGAVHVQKITVQ
jgi:uncharacterized repeat protein (TIGR02543 family)